MNEWPMFFTGMAVGIAIGSWLAAGLVLGSWLFTPRTPRAPDSRRRYLHTNPPPQTKPPRQQRGDSDG